MVVVKSICHTPVFTSYSKLATLILRDNWNALVLFVSSHAFCELAKVSSGVSPSVVTLLGTRATKSYLSGDKSITFCLPLVSIYVSMFSNKGVHLKC